MGPPEEEIRRLQRENKDLREESVVSTYSASLGHRSWDLRELSRNREDKGIGVPHDAGRIALPARRKRMGSRQR